MSRAFFDSNVLIYALGNDRKAIVARTIYQAGGRASVQCRNELANVARNKLKLDWDELDEAINDVRVRCAPIMAIDEALHRNGLRLAQRYRLSVYDGMIVAAALAADLRRPLIRRHASRTDRRWPAEDLRSIPRPAGLTAHRPR